ncbi:hypothetical protein V1511DRAFT_498209 [Dipodascopsis uninucleata]
MPPLNHQYRQIWTGSIDSRFLGSGLASIEDVQIWSATKFKSNEIISPDATLSIAAYIDAGEIPLWTVSGPLLDIYSTLPETMIFMKRVFLNDISIEEGLGSRALIVDIFPKSTKITTLCFMCKLISRESNRAGLPTPPNSSSSNLSSLNTSAQMKYSASIVAIPLYIPNNFTDIIPNFDTLGDLQFLSNIQGVFLDPSDEDIKDANNAMRRNEKLDQLLQRRTSMKLQQQNDNHKFQQRPSLSENNSNVINVIKIEDDSDTRDKSDLSYIDGQPQTRKSNIMLQRMVLAALRIRGIHREHVEFKSLYHHTYKASVFALVSPKFFQEYATFCAEENIF